MINKNRNPGLDILKALLPIGVIFIHIGQSSLLRSPFNVVGFIVPLFIMITGYFYDSQYKKDGGKSQLIKMFNLFVLSNFIYYIWNFICTIIEGEMDLSYFFNCVNRNILFEMVIYKSSPFEEHLWYLTSMFEVLFVLYVLFKLRINYRVIYLSLFIPVLLSIFGDINFIFVDKTYFNLIGGSIFGSDLQYFALGMLTKEFTRSKYYTNKAIVYSLGSILFLSISNIYSSTYVGYLCLFFTFMFFNTAFKPANNNKALSFLSWLGRYYSKWVYILHIIVQKLLKYITFGKEIHFLNWITITVIVYFSCVLFMFVINKLVSKIMGKEVYL